MKVIILIFTLMVFNSSFLNAQPPISIGIGSSATFRILDLKSSGFSEREIEDAKYYETFRPSYTINVGFPRYKGGRIQSELGFAYQWSRFGTRKYSLPDSIFNYTPQYFELKESIQQNQVAIYYRHYFGISDQLANIRFFLGAEILYNHRGYYTRSIDYDIRGEPKLRSKGSGRSNELKPLNIAVAFGGLLPILRQQSKLTLEYIIGAHLRGYEIHGRGPNGYLPFNKTTKGYLYNIGLRMSYVLTR